MNALPLVPAKSEAQSRAWRHALERAGLPPGAVMGGKVTAEDAAKANISGRFATLQSVAGEDGLTLDQLVAAIDNPD